jgi:signal transduction histidine kinase
VQLESQYLDISRFTAETDEVVFAELLQTRYRDRQIPVVVTVAVPASRFADKFGATIWPRARIVHALVDGDQLDAVMKRGDPFIPRIYDYRRTVEAALTLLPDVEQVVLIAGASDPDRRWLEQAELSLAPLQARIRISRLADLRWSEILERSAQLPERTIAIPLCFFADADARTFVSAEAVLDIARVANRPVFVHSTPWIGSGAMGGYVQDPDAAGRYAGDVVLKVLAHQDPSATPGGDIGLRWIFDAHQLRRWNVAERDLPAGSLVINRTPSAWSQYRGYILGALSLIVVQALLIGGLLVQRTRRRRAESAVRTSEAALRVSYQRIRQLAGRLIGAQETARTRIARDLHDDVCQELASVSIAVGDVKERRGDIRDTQNQQALSQLQRRTQDLVSGVRRLSHDLHPSMLRHAGLPAALEAHCIEVEQRYDVQVSCDTSGDLRQLPGDTAVALFRISQEALRNAATHGSARRVSLSITRNSESIELLVQDDGAGFDREAIGRRGDGLGLVSMEERARLVGGVFFVTTAPGTGTTIRANIPLASGPGRGGRRDRCAGPEFSVVTSIADRKTIMRLPRVLIVDDHRLFAEGLSSVIKDRFEIVGTIADGRLLIDAVRRLQPDVVLLDVSMPHVSGLDLLLELKTKRVECRTIMLTMHADPRMAADALKGRRRWICAEGVKPRRARHGARCGAARTNLPDGGSHQGRPCLDVGAGRSGRCRADVAPARSTASHRPGAARQGNRDGSQSLAAQRREHQVSNDAGPERTVDGGPGPLCDPAQHRHPIGHRSPGASPASATCSRFPGGEQ